MVASVTRQTIEDPIKYILERTVGIMPEVAPMYRLRLRPAICSVSMFYCVVGILTRSVIFIPKASSATTVRGTLVINRIVERPRSRNICAPIPFSY